MNEKRAFSCKPSLRLVLLEPRRRRNKTKLVWADWLFLLAVVAATVWAVGRWGGTEGRCIKI